jgi:23S rRNA pseudouridine1911/1915/1917 synthase
MSDEPSPTRWRVSEQSTGERLDTYLAAIFDTSRSQAARWIRLGRVIVGSRAVKPSLRLEGGEWISCAPLAVSQEERLEPEEGDLSLLYEDNDVIVVDKAPEIVVHPGAGRRGGTLAHYLLGRFPEIASVGGPGRPGIVHRLDKGTSGVMVVARTSRAYLALSAAFAERRVEKSYLAIVFGTPAPAQGTIDAAIARHPRHRKQMTVSPRGRPARSHYSTLASCTVASLLEIEIESGRTHQIRVHLKSIGHPIVGDPVYGEDRWKGLPKKRRAAFRDFERPALHAWALAFRHPVTNDRMQFRAAPPRDFLELWRHISGIEPPLGSSSGKA